MYEISLETDFAAAHRVCQVYPDDWGLKTCTLTDLRGTELADDVPVFLNTAGTFGFSTAGHWWGRSCKKRGISLPSCAI